MSEKKRDCPRCDAETVHSEWTESICGGRETKVERVIEAFISFGFAEIDKKKWRRCLRCGFTRRVS